MEEIHRFIFHDLFSDAIKCVNFVLVSKDFTCLLHGESPRYLAFRELQPQQRQAGCPIIRYLVSSDAHYNQKRREVVLKDLTLAVWDPSIDQSATTVTAFDKLFSQTMTAVTTTAVFYVQGRLCLQPMVIEGHDLSSVSRYRLPLHAGLAASYEVCTWDFVLRRDVKKRQRKQLRDNVRLTLNCADIDPRVRRLLQLTLDRIRIKKTRKLGRS